MARFKKLIFALCGLVYLGGCRAPERFEKDKVKVLSTIGQIGDLVSQVGGDRVSSLTLIRGELDPHSYEIVKGDAEKIEEADLIFYNGLGLEHGASLFSILKNSSKATPLAEKVQALSPEKILCKNGVVDPHIWMDISLWKETIDPIVQELSQKDPEGAFFYGKRGEDLKKKMELAHLDLFQSLQAIPQEKRYLVTSHDAFQYFTKSYLAEPQEEGWQDRFSAPEGLAPEGQMSVIDLKKVIEFLKKRDVSVIFSESNVNKDSIEKIASSGREMGLNLTICSEPLYGDAMGSFSYLEMMAENKKTIQKYLCSGL